MQRLAPFPMSIDGVRSDGSLARMPKWCQVCPTRECEVAKSTEITTCSFGLDYIQLSDRSVVFGFLVKDAPTRTSAKIKRMKQIGLTHSFPKAQVLSFSEAAEEFAAQEHKDVEERKRIILENYKASKQYEDEFLEDLRPQVLKGLSFLHDYRQINGQISQHINVLLEERYRGNGDSEEGIDELLEKAKYEEVAIYWASKFLEKKITTAKFLLEPEFINDKAACTKFSLHGLVLKYLRIYKMQFENKRIKTRVIGQNYQGVVGNPDAIGVIPHTLIDNAAKYAPHNSAVEVAFEEISRGVKISVQSLGPEILDSEKEKIFEAFFRGSAAQKDHEEGAGYGLYLAQFIAKNHLGSEVCVSQERRSGDRFLTEFTVVVPYLAPACVGA